jgi:hypothetical protein
MDISYSDIGLNHYRVFQYLKFINKFPNKILLDIIFLIGFEPTVFMLSILHLTTVLQGFTKMSVGCRFDVGLCSWAQKHWGGGQLDTLLWASWGPRRSAMLVAESPSSCQVPILTFFDHQKFSKDFSGILAGHHVKRFHTKKKFQLFLAFFGGHCMLSVKKPSQMQISSDTQKGKKEEK